jgi:hypothetical protein
MEILRSWFMRGKLFKPFLVILMKPGFVVIDEHGGGDMHCVYERDSFSNSALFKTLNYLLSDVDKSPSSRKMKPKFFTIGFHISPVLVGSKLR